MEKLAIIFIVFSKLNSLYAQSNPPVFLNSKSFYYDSTDFSKIDSLESWFYVLLDKNPDHEDTVKPIGRLIFQKGQPIKGYTPNFTFQIFNIKDSSYCFNKSQSVRTLSSCVPPNVAGDMIRINQYIFLNTNICLQCKSPDDRFDHCRPVINKIFSTVDITKVTSLEELVKQFPIQGQIVKLPF